MGRTFGYRLQAERKMRGLSRAALGEGLLAPGRVGSLEAGTVEPSGTDLQALSARLAGRDCGEEQSAGPAVMTGLAARQAWDERNYPAAVSLALQSAQLRRDREEPTTAWEDTVLAVRALRNLHRFDEAVRFSAALVSDPAARIDTARRAQGLALLATARQGAGQLDPAVHDAVRALRAALSDAVGAEVLLEVLLALVAVLGESGRTQQAWTHCTALLMPLLPTLRDPADAGRGWWAAGNVAFLCGDPGAGAHFHERAAQLLSPDDDLQLWAAFNRGSASKRVAAGLHDAATLQCIDRAETAMAVLEAPAAERLDLLRCRGRYLHLAGNPQAGAELLTRAYEARSALSPQAAAELALQLGLSLADLGDTRAAREHLAESSRWYRSAGAVNRSAHAARLVGGLDGRNAAGC
ncbi:hypothetical protein BN1051_00808 [Arthrobacter saudimassiliensis]|uniref:HTH cro/C1-type domain-containing protein n=1 Tax=Arthrobacter saudimassiliensis TaxID=1461584 RepID=A0A078MMH9_9MICC|nr:hypothetical protein BN1051_00808 [Arthrobacter saudimassiliensis]